MWVRSIKISSTRGLLPPGVLIICAAITWSVIFSWDGANWQLNSTLLFSLTVNYANKTDQDLSPLLPPPFFLIYRTLVTKRTQKSWALVFVISWSSQRYVHSEMLLKIASISLKLVRHAKWTVTAAMQHAQTCVELEWNAVMGMMHWYRRHSVMVPTVMLLMVPVPNAAPGSATRNILVQHLAIYAEANLKLSHWTLQTAQVRPEVEFEPKMNCCLLERVKI